jgi:DNA-binding CsgD family transcriptional regulator/PAS domain-containing protein
MAQADQLSRTVEQIYAAALDAGRWREALVAIEEFTGSTGAVLDLVPVSDRARPRTLAGSFSRDDCAEYAKTYQSICPRIAFAVAHPDLPTHFDRLVLSETEMDHDPVYEWFRGHGLRYYVAGSVGFTKQHFAYFSLQRSRRQGHVQREDIELFELVRPHLAQAVAIADSLDTLAAHRRFSDAMLNALPQAIFGLDHTGSLLFVNASGERMLERRDPMASRAGRLAAAIGPQQPQLNALIENALAGGPGGAMRLFRTDGRQPCTVRVSPLVLDEAERFLDPAVLVIVSDPAAAGAIDGETLRALYDLTPTETRTAAALADGHSIQSAAQLLGVSGETLRSHLKAVFRKVGVSRQQDLVRILVELEMTPLAHPSASPE